MDARISALKKRIGVTRLANITGLDRLGYPVIAAMRPLSRNLSVSFGKGPTPEIASLSAIMEAAELFFSEHPPHAPVTAAYAELADGSAMDPSLLHPIEIGDDLESVPLEWVWGSYLMTKRPVLVPWDLISMDYSMRAREKKRPFEFGATGLAAGFDETAATLHGLYEVIERDCHNEWNLSADEKRADTLIDLDSVNCPEFREQLDKIRSSGLDALAWDMTGLTGIPCYLVEIFDFAPGAITAYVQGAAANLSANSAIRMALAEALQIRLTYISGSRDDLEWSDYGERYAEIVGNREDILSGPVGGRRMPVEHAAETHGSDLAEVLLRLAELGLGNVISVNLAGEEEPVRVVKVIVPLLKDVRDIERKTETAAAAEEIFA